MRVIRAGDGSPDGERLTMVEALTRQKLVTYGGYDIVRAATALMEIAAVIDPASLGLEQVGDRRFVGAHGEFMRVVEVAAMKGATYVIRWGVSLPYVPLGLKRPLRYGRTVKSAQLSLWWGSHRDEDVPGPEARGYIDTFHGVRCVHDEAETVWRSNYPRVLEFWDETSDLPGVLNVATGLMNAPGATNWGTPLVGAVAALTAARLGRRREAYEYAAVTPNRPSEAALLAEMIDQELAGPRG